ncbi:MAG: aspartyl-tRNA(Asn)/glutamyl-tRNA (Gln) amidotransferase subunit B [Parcubacteria group bacterium Gr01-1014_3]|nr:MAG: aspartyl-tRNA(Asn)/glutamyl-tRNA (Gln) amidotransferase subunit B [Parcubacteria group bacterium Gr01-1014_3]
MKYQPTIGLEIHAELKTATKMFCECLNDPMEKHPNTNICPICSGHPGTLPTINKKAVEAVLKVGMALNGDIPQFSKFDRKNYFYPDLPKGYQISQYDLPLIFGGLLNGVRLTRIHLEEDTGRLLHADDKKSSLVDLNRASVPLMELVTEPDIKNAEQAVAFARELQLILRYLGVSDADMDKGQMRVEANVSISSGSTLGTKVEVKNINSFKAVQGAIDYEIKRQEEVLESGGKVVQETRGWDDVHNKTVSQRLKESAHDYRYFPEPDLPPLDMSHFDLKSLKLDIPELPSAKRLRFAKEFGLKSEQADILAADRAMAEYFEEAVSELAADLPATAGDSAKLPEKTQLLYNYLTSDLRGIMSQTDTSFSNLKIDPENFADLVELIANDKLSSRGAKNVLAKMSETGLDPSAVMEQENLGQVSDEGSIRPTAEQVLTENPKAIEDYKKGKMNALQFLVGKTMAALKGRGNPEVIRKILQELLATR